MRTDPRGEEKKMSEGTAPVPPAPVRRRTVPLVTSLVIALLAVGCLTEGFIIYWKQWQVEASSQITEQVRGTIARYERDLEQTNYTLQQFTQVVGSSDLGRLAEQVKGAKPPTLQGYLSELEAKLQTTVTKLDEMQSGWSAMQKARDDAIKAQVTAESELTKKAEEFRQTADRLVSQLQAEQDGHRKDVEGLQQKVADLEQKVNEWKAHYDDAANKYNQALQRQRSLEVWYQERLDRLRLLLAQTLRVPPPPGLSPALLANDRLELRVAGAESVGNISYVRFPIPPDRTLAVGMRFLVYDSQRRPKCLVQLTNVVPERAPVKALGLVGERYSAEPVAAGDLAELDLAYEELRKSAPTMK
jgi:archaellum component FlaC